MFPTSESAGRYQEANRLSVEWRCLPPERRDAFITALSARDPDMAARVETLLAQDSERSGGTADSAVNKRDRPVSVGSRNRPGRAGNRVPRGRHPAPPARGARGLHRPNREPPDRAVAPGCAPNHSSFNAKRRRRAAHTRQ